MSFLFGSVFRQTRQTCVSTNIKIATKHKYQPKGRICKKEASLLPQSLVSTSLLKKGSFNKKTKPISKVFNIQKRTFGDKEQELTDKLFKVIETEKVSPERLAKCKVLIEAGADLFAENDEGKTALRLMMDQGDSATMIHIIEQFTEDQYNRQNSKGFNSLLYDVLLGLHEGSPKNAIFLCLTEYIKDLTGRSNEGYSILDLAILKNEFIIASMIVNLNQMRHPEHFKQEINRLGIDGKTLLHRLVFDWDELLHRTIMVHVLLAFGADPTIRNIQDISAQQLMEIQRPVLVVKVLDNYYCIPKGDVNEQSPTGKTALHVAIMSICYGNIKGYELVEMLLNKGADPTIADHKGRTPLSLAKEEDLPNIENLLYKYLSLDLYNQSYIRKNM